MCRYVKHRFVTKPKIIAALLQNFTEHHTNTYIVTEPGVIGMAPPVVFWDRKALRYLLLSRFNLNTESILGIEPLEFCIVAAQHQRWGSPGSSMNRLMCMCFSPAMALHCK